MSSRMTRRDFVQSAAVGLGLAAALPYLTDSAFAAPQEKAGGRARATASDRSLTLENDLISGTWEASPEGLRFLGIHDPRSGRRLAGGQGAFLLMLEDGTRIDAARMTLRGEPRTEVLRAAPRASRFSERLPGRQIVAVLRDADERIEATWRAILRDGSGYLREEVTLKALGKDFPLYEVTLIDSSAPGAVVAGSVKGSPVVAGPWIFALEHPLSTSSAGAGRIRCTLPRELPLRAGRALTCSCVKGIAGDGQMRRDFQEYLERERAHPYRTFLHYNSWYDLGYFTPFDEASSLTVIKAFGTELRKKRGVKIDSFLFDDGWDDHRLWGFNSGFPRGFTALRRAAGKYGAAPGVWLSPWGGYGKPRQERLQFGKEQGFETNDEGFALSGPVYFRRFREVCLEMIRNYGVNQFKIDGTGDAATAFPGSEFGSDFEAALRLIEDLRAEKPDVYVNLTTGTYPSPFWLRHADSIWRGGNDHGFTGVGTDRQRWITYRDADTFQGVVLKGPLFPINSLMLHGLIYARHAKKLDTDPGGDFPSEIRSYFGTGTQLQEMYVTHSLLSPRDWDTLAESAKWSRRNAAVLADSHWVGGDPGRLEPYGWASWTPAKGILTLRNPSDRPQAIQLDLRNVFELPPGAPERYSVRSPWKEAKDAGADWAWAGSTRSLPLDPFQVLTLEFTPA